MISPLKGSIIPPHDKKSRIVKEEDIERVQADSKVMWKLCLWPHGVHASGGMALCHAQVEADDPMRFFVTRSGIVIMNVEILHTTAVPIMKVEGCLSFPDKLNTYVMRYNRLKCRYWTLKADGKILRAESDFKGVNAQIIQHELDHFEGKHLFEYTPEKGPYIFNAIEGKNE